MIVIVKNIDYFAKQLRKISQKATKFEKCLFYRFNSFRLNGSSIHIETISVELSIMYYKGFRTKISIKCISVLNIFFILANSDEMPPYLVFHLGIHCLPMYLVTSIQKG